MPLPAHEQADSNRRAENAAVIELTDSRVESVGAFTVRRALPRAGRRTIGAWCFADHMGPADVTENAGLDVGPHPHIGLQTVTWLVDGQLLHRDSLGFEQVIRAGQLNLMTAGGGIAHAEEATGHYRGVLEGIQLWIAQPDSTRAGGNGFEHHAELPRFDVAGGVATLMVGEHEHFRSPARHDTPLVGMELDLRADTVLPLRTDFEYGLILLAGELAVVDPELTVVTPGRLCYLGIGREQVELTVREPVRAILIGGIPFDEPIVMWWNFVARSRAEIDAAYESWRLQDDRFGRVESRLPLIPARPPFWQG